MLDMEHAQPCGAQAGGQVNPGESKTRILTVLRLFERALSMNLPRNSRTPPRHLL